MRDGESPAASTAAAGQGDMPRTLSPARYLAWLYSPESQQPAFSKLCEIESEIAGSLRPGIDHHVAHARLQWWQEECERCAQGRPVHPLTRELVKAYGTVAAGVPSPFAGLRGFVDTAIWDLAGATFETRKELTAYCERWAAAMFETAVALVSTASGTHSVKRNALEPQTGAAATAAVSRLQTGEAAEAAEAAHATRAAQAARMMRASGSSSREASGSSDSSGGAALDSTAPTATNATGAISRWRVLGAAVREIELLTDLAREAHAGRVRVPLDELDRVGATASSLAKPPWPEGLVTLLRERHETLRTTVGDHVDALGEHVSALGREEQANHRGLLVWAALAWSQSARAQSALPGIISPRRYHALADGWRAWRAARRATAGKFRLG
jgi:phytoene/squalene synthetase